MKPLDLQVGIQNSYEAARSEAVRLERPHVAGMLSNEDAQRDQVVRDHTVTRPESKTFQDDLFTAEEYHPDYADAGSSGRDKKKGSGKKQQPVEEAQKKTDKAATPENTGGDGKFSTYA